MPDALAFNHLALLAVIDQSVFVPTFFNTWTVVEPTARNGGRALRDTATVRPDDLPVGQDAVCDSEYLCDWQNKFDYLLWVDCSTPPTPLPAYLVPVIHGSFFTLYKITPPNG